MDFKDWSLYGVTSNGYLIQIDTVTGKSTRIKTFSADFWGLSTSGSALSGSITTPKDGYNTGPASLLINASAQYFGGKSLDQVEFYVSYGGIWRSLGSDNSSPYASGWDIPSDLVSQQALLRIDVVGTDTQSHVQRSSYAGGVRRINYFQSLNNPNVVENWVPVRAYLNQRSLTPYGDSKCNVSSIAMLLAMEGEINADYLTMANKANELWSYMTPSPGVDQVCKALRSAIPSAYCSGSKNHTEGWQLVRKSIDNGHPIIVDSRPHSVTKDGHYAVAVGYKEESGKNYLIMYDPFGQWKGQLNQYYGNTVNDPASHVGKWVYYDFERFPGSEVYLFASVDPSTSPAYLKPVDVTQLTPPDPISEEARVSVIYTGPTINPFFADVPVTHLYYQDIQILYANNLTGGCLSSPLKFCPDEVMNRGQAAAFMLRANFGPSYVPPTPTHIFKDNWTRGPWAEAWAEAMKNNGYSAGCVTSPLKYCPWTQIPREQAVIFILKLKYGKDYMPPPASGLVFADMADPSFYATPWAEQAYSEGLIPNCGVSSGKPKLCPKDLVSRGLAAHMIVKAKNLTMP
jgi:hypothetical protein